MQYLQHLNSMGAMSKNLEGLDLQNLNLSDEFPELDLLNMQELSAMDRPSPNIQNLTFKLNIGGVDLGSGTSLRGCDNTENLSWYLRLWCKIKW